MLPSCFLVMLLTAISLSAKWTNTRTKFKFKLYLHLVSVHIFLLSIKFFQWTLSYVHFMDDHQTPLPALPFLLIIPIHQSILSNYFYSSNSDIKYNWRWRLMSLQGRYSDNATSCPLQHVHAHFFFYLACLYFETLPKAWNCLKKLSRKNKQSTFFHKFGFSRL